MKLMIQVPCFNEEEALPVTIKALPRQVEGFDRVEWLIIDDGSTDKTVEVARELGVHHIIRHTSNQGLARAFATGLDACLRLGADVIVNTDADNQYNADDIVLLVKPIVDHAADMVIGDRQTDTVKDFSWTKRRLQKLGSWVVQRASRTNIPDTTSGFRAYSRAAAMKLNIVSTFTYTLETIIQAGAKNITLTHVPVRTNPKLRESRLFTGLGSYIVRSTATIGRIYAMYRPLRVFSVAGGVLFLAGLAIGGRFLYFYFTDGGDGHIQSLLLAIALLLVGFQTGMTGLLADLISRNRQLIEESLWRVRRMELGESTRTDKKD